VHSSFFVLLSINSRAAKFQDAAEFQAPLCSDLVSEIFVARTFAVTILPVVIQPEALYPINGSRRTEADKHDVRGGGKRR
jgi:hypothetical protein